MIVTVEVCSHISYYAIILFNSINIYQSYFNSQLSLSAAKPALDQNATNTIKDLYKTIFNTTDFDLKGSPTDFIIGGTPARKFAWPWQVLIFVNYGGGYICGGSVIADRWILTAAHCLYVYYFIS